MRIIIKEVEDRKVQPPLPPKDFEPVTPTPAPPPPVVDRTRYPLEADIKIFILSLLKKKK